MSIFQNGKTMKPLVSLGADPSDCWEWQGTINKRTGYGKKTWMGNDVLAHRWVYEMLFGPIPDGLVINHKCSNRRCVNPHHLEVVTQTENCRHGKGTILSIEAVKEIKAARGNRKWGDGARLARKHKVSSALIHDIWHGRAWADIN